MILRMFLIYLNNWRCKSMGLYEAFAELKNGNLCVHPIQDRMFFGKNAGIFLNLMGAIDN